MYAAEMVQYHKSSEPSMTPPGLDGVSSTISIPWLDQAGSPVFTLSRNLSERGLRGVLSGGYIEFQDEGCSLDA